MVLNFWLETFILLLHILKFFMFLPMNIYYARNMGSKSAYNIFWLFIYGFLILMLTPSKQIMQMFETEFN